jgi:hypothetical protein
MMLLRRDEKPDLGSKDRGCRRGRAQEAAAVGRNGKRAEGEDEQDLGGDSQRDVLFDVRFGVRPSMQALERSQRLAREARVKKLNGIGQHGPACTEQDSPLVFG